MSLDVNAGAKATGTASGSGAGSRNAWVVLAVGLALIGAACWFLTRMKDFQRLGRPGVKIVPRQVMGDTGAVVGTNAVALPLVVPGYQATNLVITRAEFEWLPRDTTYGRVEYTGQDGFRMLMSAVLMGVDRTSIHKPEYCLVGQGFRIDSLESARIPIAEPARYELPVKKMVMTREAKRPDGSVERSRALYVFWFVADGRLSADHNQRMLSMAWDLVTSGVLQRWAYIACFSECPEGQEDAQFAQMSKLIAAAVPQFQLTTGNAGIGAASGESAGAGNGSGTGKGDAVAAEAAGMAGLPGLAGQAGASGLIQGLGKNRDVTSRSTN